MGKQRLAHLFLHIINIIYLMSGATVLTFGIIGLSSPSTIFNMFSYIPGFSVLTNVLVYEGLSLATAIYFTSLGSVVLVLSFVGGVGTLSEHKIILYIYGITKLFLVLFQLATIVFNAVDPNWMEPNVRNAMILKLEQGYSAVIINSNNSTIEMPSREEDSAWAIMQLENACCGVENYTDYVNNSKISEQPWRNNYSAILDYETAQIPLSCCMQRVQYKLATSTDDFIDPYNCMVNPPSYVNSHGCAHVVMDVVLQYNYAYVIVAAGFLALEVISVALTVHIVRSNDNKVRPISPETV